MGTGTPEASERPCVPAAWCPHTLSPKSGHLVAQRVVLNPERFLPTLEHLNENQKESQPIPQALFPQNWVLVPDGGHPWVPAYPGSRESIGPPRAGEERPVGSGEEGTMPLFSGSWQSLPGPELLNAHWSQTLDSVSQAALCQACHDPERRSLSSLLAKAKPPKRASAARGTNLCSGSRGFPLPPAWEPQSWKGKCAPHAL